MMWSSQFSSPEWPQADCQTHIVCTFHACVDEDGVSGWLPIATLELLLWTGHLHPFADEPISSHFDAYLRIFRVGRLANVGHVHHRQFSKNMLTTLNKLADSADTSSEPWHQWNIPHWGLSHWGSGSIAMFDDTGESSKWMWERAR